MAHITERELMAGVDLKRLQACVAGTYMEKMAASQDPIHRALQWVGYLGLENTEAKHILDLGCGIPYFVRACNMLGHDAIGLDMHEHIHGEASRILGTPFVAHVISREPLPVELASLDIVTMNTVSMADWRGVYPALGADLRARLNPGGRCLFAFHQVNAWMASTTLWKRWLRPCVARDYLHRMILIEV